MMRKTMLLIAALGIAGVSLVVSAGSASAHGGHYRFQTYSSCDEVAEVLRQEYYAWCSYEPGGIGGGAYPWVLHSSR